MILKNKIITVILLLMICIYTIYGAFQLYNWGARAAGIGNAFVGIADDSNCMTFNVAGLAIVGRQEIQALYAKPFMGVENVELGFLSLKYVGTIKGLGKIGLVVDQFDAGSGLYKEFSYGIGIADLVYKMQDGTKIFAGAKVKYIGHSYSYDETLKSYSEIYGDPVVSKGNAKSAVAADVGILAKKDFITVGISAENINQPDLGLYYEDKVPMLIRIGGSYFVPKQNLTLAAEVDLRQQNYGENSMNYGFGVEYEVKKNIFVRGGYSTKSISLGGGFFTPMQEKYLLGIDAAYLINSGEISGNDMQVTVKLRW